MKLWTLFLGTKIHLLGFVLADFRLRTSILLILAREIENPYFIIVLEFRIQLSRTFTKLEGRSADQNFARVRTIDSAARNTTGSSGSIGKVLPSAGVDAPLENVEFGIIADIVKNGIEISRISKICYSHFFCLPNVSSKRSCFFVTDTSMTPKKIQSEPRVFFRF